MILGDIIFNDQIWLLGGGHYSTGVDLLSNVTSDVWSSYDGLEWKLGTKSAPWRPRVYHSIVNFDKKLWVFMGSDENLIDLNDIWFTDSGIDWNKLKNIPIMPGHASSVVSHNDKVYLFNGSNLSTDVWALSKINLVK